MRRFSITAWLRMLTAHAWSTVIFLVGMAMLLVGVVLLPLPGPGSVVVVLGLAVFSARFVWAQHGLDKVKAAMLKLRERARRKPAPQPSPAAKAPIAAQRRPLRIRRPSSR